MFDLNRKLDISDKIKRVLGFEKMKDAKILKRMSETKQTIAKVLEARWTEIRKDCKDTDGKFCAITGNLCRWELCPKLAERGREEGGRHG